MIRTFYKGHNNKLYTIQFLVYSLTIIYNMYEYLNMYVKRKKNMIYVHLFYIFTSVQKLFLILPAH